MSGTPSHRAALLRAARGLEHTGNVGTSGNLSVRSDEGMLITPSGIPYAQLEESDLVWLELGAAPRADQNPSSEWRFHGDIYQAFGEAQAVVHCHSPGATALACLGRGIPPFHYEVAFAGGKDVRCAPYATFGTQALSEHVLEALKGRRACLLAHHGLVCFDRSIERALALAEKLEQLADMYLRCLAIAEPDRLSDEEMATVLQGFRHYGMR